MAGLGEKIFRVRVVCSTVLNMQEGFFGFLYGVFGWSVVCLQLVWLQFGVGKKFKEASCWMSGDDDADSTNLISLRTFFSFPIIHF